MPVTPHLLDCMETEALPPATTASCASSESSHAADTNPADALADFHKQLVAIRQDPQIIGLAHKWAGAPDLAEDALQIAYYKVATVRDPESIENLHAYFFTATKNEINALRAQRQKTIPLQNPGAALEPGQHGTVVCGPARSRPIDDLVRISLLARFVRARLAVRRESLLAAIPARSDDSPRYRTVIYDSAKQILLDGLNGKASDADSNDAFRAAYPEYFAQPDASSNTLHQRFSRARADVRAVLQAVVRRDELT
jgi:DNA-directed RNA polymerase specialized sigma24 family protein